jgi:hypothetical protein
MAFLPEYHRFGGIRSKVPLVAGTPGPLNCMLGPVSITCFVGSTRAPRFHNCSSTVGIPVNMDANPGAQVDSSSLPKSLRTIGDAWVSSAVVLEVPSVIVPSGEQFPAESAPPGPQKTQDRQTSAIQI